MCGCERVNVLLFINSFRQTLLDWLAVIVVGVTAFGMILVILMIIAPNNEVVILERRLAHKIVTIQLHINLFQDIGVILIITKQVCEFLFVLLVNLVDLLHFCIVLFLTHT